MNFLAYLFEQGYQHMLLDGYRSTISLVLDGCDVAEHPMVMRLWTLRKRGRLNHITLVRGMWTWLHHTSVHKRKNKMLIPLLAELSLTMLMALTKLSRSADLTKLDLNHRTYSVNGVTFLLTMLFKQPN